LERVADFDALEELGRAAAARARVPEARRPEIGETLHGVIALEQDVARVHVLLIGSRDAAAHAFHREIRDDAQAVVALRAGEAEWAPERLLVLRLAGAENRWRAD